MISRKHHDFLIFSAKGEANVTSAAEIPTNSFKKFDGKPYYAYKLPHNENMFVFPDFSATVKRNVRYVGQRTSDALLHSERKDMVALCAL